MLTINNAYRNNNNVHFKGHHQGLRKFLSKESRELLDAAVKEINEAEKTLKTVKCGKAHLANNGRNGFNTLQFQIKNTKGDLIELYKGEAGSNGYRFALIHTPADSIKKSVYEQEMNTLYFDNMRKTVNFKDQKPEEPFGCPGFWSRIENNSDLLQKVETFIKKYVPMFISKK